uniref:Uncharacterized protein n=1 Tax=Zooxanthella nutricula TaxID=1333877 RepID=A0A7S2JK76_9DINO|mmetsp:Transcript_32478/g.98170  ORF Transcript_32478/g.98170 Transcript_32478/m.98170 type:complete len:303 (+) Transcript_32478:80-988(+)
MTAALEGAEVWMCEAVPIMRQMCREVISANAKDIASKKGLVNLMPAMMSTRLQVGEDVPERFDVIVSEVMDIWCLGEGVIPTMRHAHQKLLAQGGVIIPSRLTIYVQPLELQLWAKAERDYQTKLTALGETFKAKFSPMRIQQFSHRMLCDEPAVALEIDLCDVPKRPADGAPNLQNLCIRMGGQPALRANISQMTVSTAGVLSGYGIWWEADLGNGHQLSNAPTSPQRSWKQLVRWLDKPRFVADGEPVQVLACYNENQVNVEDIHMTDDIVAQCQEQMAAAGAAAPQQQQQQHCGQRADR